MKSIYIIGTVESGKTALCLGLALKFREEGYRVSYFKPVGIATGIAGMRDDDTELMRTVLDIKVPFEKMTLFTMGYNYLTRYGPENSEKYMADIKSAYNEISRDCDIVIIEGTTSPQAMLALGLDASTISRSLGAKMLMVSRVNDDFGMDELILNLQYMKKAGVDIMGTLFNFVPTPLLERTRNVYVPILERKGFNIRGIVPERRELTAPTVKEIYDVLGGEILEGESNLDLLVENFLVGAMTTDSALRYFRRSKNKAVITGGDRADIIHSALETSTSVLILTGNLYPDVRVLSKASEKGVPVILVPYDTYTTIEKLHGVSCKIKATDEEGKRQSKELVENYIDWKGILKELEGTI
ncbi:phosphate acetyltransferase [archaeon BMS3Bbin15]|nr:phosphate acetyltransferase [archaeon BMS3Bbin15]